jgi:hypothetical protein
MKHLLILLFVLAIPQQPPSTVIVPIQNPSFAQGEIGWQFGPSSGVDNGSAYAGYGGSFSQVLTTTPAQLQEYKPGYTIEGKYILKFSPANYFPSYPGQYNVELYFGTQQLCEAHELWGTKTFTEVTITCPSPGYLIVDKALPLGGPVQGQQHFVLTFTGNGWPTRSKDYSLSFAEVQ